MLEIIDHLEGVVGPKKVIVDLRRQGAEVHERDTPIFQSATSRQFILTWPTSLYERVANVALDQESETAIDNPAVNLHVQRPCWDHRSTPGLN